MRQSVDWIYWWERKVLAATTEDWTQISATRRAKQWAMGTADLLHGFSVRE